MFTLTKKQPRNDIGIKTAKPKIVFHIPLHTKPFNPIKQSSRKGFEAENA